MGIRCVARIAGYRRLDTEYGQSLSNINSLCAWLVLFVLGSAIDGWGLLLNLILVSSHSRHLCCF